MFTLIPESKLSEEDIERREKYNNSRNLYNKYRIDELENFLAIDLYEALDLDFLRFKPIHSEMLKYAVRRKSIEYHPIKNSGKTAAFLVITKASEIFSNKHKKALYDSLLLNEKIPQEREYKSLDDFLEDFESIFEENGAFSEVQPVPSLRKASVDEFYRFWNNFKTTRVYYDPEDVFNQSNSSRKHILELKKDVINKRKVGDLLRIRELVAAAYRSDPRIQRAPRLDSIKPWKEAEIKSLKRFDTLLGKSKNKYKDIATKLNSLYLSNRTPDEVKKRLEMLKKEGRRS